VSSVSFVLFFTANSTDDSAFIKKITPIKPCYVWRPPWNVGFLINWLSSVDFKRIENYI